ncbi:MAG: dipeptidyl-peptidase 3 family protein [Planctomycetota bacterium]
MFVPDSPPHPGAETEIHNKSRRWALERAGEANVVQLYADGFDKLSVRDKILCYHLYRAAVAGRDIYIDQKYKHSLELRDWLEELYLFKDALAPDAAAEIERYTKLFWLNNGPHHHETGRKEIFKLTSEQWCEAAAAAERAGAKFPWRENSTRAENLHWIYGTVLNHDADPISTNKSPAAGQDILQASAVNYYENISLAEAEAFQEKYALNSRLVKNANGELVEEVYRSGSELYQPGKYAFEIGKIIECLSDALPYAPPATAAALERLIQYYKTGDPADYREYNIAWVSDKSSVVDTVNGFIEVYADPRGRKGAFEAIVSYVNAEKTSAIRKIAAHAAWFEERMPWDHKYKKTDVRGIVANAIDVVIETGDSGPISPIGINLPNPQDIREMYGSKSVNLSNVAEAYENSTSHVLRKEFCYNADELDRAERFALLTSEVHTNMHEVIGHASGRLSPRVGGEPAKALCEYYSTLEEARADLVALWFIGDPETIQMEMSPGEDAALAEYESYTRSALLLQLRKVKTGDRLEEDHARNRQLIANWILHNSNAIERRERGSKTFFVVTDREAWRQAAGKLLARIMQIKGEGDYAAAKELIETYGVRFDIKLREEVLRRVEAADPPAYTGFVQPRLIPVRAASGEIVNIQITYPCDLAEQMLEWSGRRAEPAAP